MDTKNLRRISQFCEENPAFSESSIRWHVFHAAQNGLNESGAIIRIGRAVYIDTDRFREWVEKHKTNNNIAV